MIDLERLRRQSLWFSRLTLALLVATVAVIVVPTLVALGVSARQGDEWREIMIFSMVFWAPAIFYLYALWAVRGAFAEFAAGGTFGPSIANGCVRAGSALTLGAAMSAIGVPNLRRAFNLRLDGTIGEVGTILHVDTAYLAVGTVGLALILIGRLLTRATELQSEVTDLRGELDEIF